MRNVLDLFDQTFFRCERATGVTNLVQCVWVYDRTIDMNGLLEFHRHLRRGRLSRRIERSPLPFGRDRWVSASTQSGLEIVTRGRRREEFETWLDEQASAPVDAEHGPGWRLAMLPFTDGGAGVSLVIPHGLTDGIGLCEALADAACGRHDPISWPAAGSRRRWQALREDARQTVRDIPGIGRAAITATRLARRNRGVAGTATPPLSQPTASSAGPDEIITLPMATIFIDADEWDVRALALGGTGNTLLAGLAARLAQRMGRVTADGRVNLGMPVNERTVGDTRANAITNVDFMVDPTPATTDLREIRSATKHALIRRNDAPDERFALLPLVPLLPQRLIRRMVSMAAGNGNSVGSSNLGEVDPGATRPDGTDADYFAIKNFAPGATQAVMHQLGGLLSLLSGRAHGRVFVSVVAYQLDGTNSNDELRRAISSTLDEFSLTATIDWPCPEPVGAGAACTTTRMKV